MPRKKTLATAVKAPKGPSQGDIARLIQDSFDLLSSELISKMVIEKEFQDDDLRKIRKNLVSVSTDIKNRAIDQLLKYY